MEPFLGQILLTGWNFAARNFALCQGQIMAISQYSALFSLLGTNYGGDGRTTFGLPDLRGRVPVGWGTGPGLTPNSLGQKGGVEGVQLTVAELPPHNHMPKLNAEGRPGNTDDPSGNMLAKLAGSYRAQAAADDVPMNDASITSNTVGGNLPHENRMPYQVLNYQIALAGVFPSRS